MSINEKLKIVRKQLKYSQTEMAERLGIKQSYYSALERGDKQIGINISNQLFQQFNISSDWFFHDKGGMYLSANSNKEGATTSPATNLKLQYFHRVNETLKKDYPEIKTLSSDLVDIFSMQEFIAALEQSEIGSIFYSPVKTLSREQKNKSYKEYKEAVIESQKKLLAYKAPIKDFAIAARKFVLAIKKIAEDIGLDYDFEDWDSRDK